MSEPNIEDRLKWLEARVSEIEFRLRRLEELLGIRKKIPQTSLSVDKNLVQFFYLSALIMIVFFLITIVVFIVLWFPRV